MAEISASAFRVTRVSPSIGRPLLAEDQRAGAPDVVVIGDDIWRRRFGADPAILGREIQLGSKRHAIVGVMPPGYRFPLAHSVWIPLRVAASYEPLTGPSVTVFARLVPGATLERHRLNDDHRSAHVGRVADHAPVPARARASLHARLHGYGRSRQRAGDASDRVDDHSPARRRVRECRDPRLRAHGNAAGRDRRAERARRKPSPDRRAAFHRGPRAGRRRRAGCDWSPVRRASRSSIGRCSNSPSAFPSGSNSRCRPRPSCSSLRSRSCPRPLSASSRRSRPPRDACRAGLQGVSAGSGSRMQMGTMWTLLIVAQVAITVAVLPQTIDHGVEHAAVSCGQQQLRHARVPHHGPGEGAADRGGALD